MIFVNCSYKLYLKKEVLGLRCSTASLQDRSVRKCRPPVNLTFLDYRVIHFVIHLTPPTRYEGINLYVRSHYAGY